MGRERMGTAFPHINMSGNAVPTREYWRDTVLLFLFIQIFSTVFMLQHFVHLKVKTELQTLQSIKNKFPGVHAQLHVYSKRLYHKIDTFSLQF